MSDETRNEDEKIQKLAKWLDFQFGGPQVGDQVRAIAAELSSVRAEAERLRAFVESCASRGIHADTMPTMRIGEPAEVAAWFYGYLDDADRNMRNAARAALAAVGSGDTEPATEAS